MALINKKSLYDLVPNEGPVGDMGSLEGPAFNYPLRGGDNIHVNSLTRVHHSPIHGQSYGPVSQDLNGSPGPTFQVDDPTSNFQISSLTDIYYSSVHNQSYGPSKYDLNGLNGPAFDNGLEPNVEPNEIDTLHENSLENKYNSTVHNLSYGPTNRDRPNIVEYIQEGQLPEGLSSLQG